MEKEFETLSDITKPIIDYLRNHHTPHTTTVITDERVVVVEDKYSLPISRYVDNDESYQA